MKERMKNTIRFYVKMVGWREFIFVELPEFWRVTVNTYKHPSLFKLLDILEKHMIDYLGRRR